MPNIKNARPSSVAAASSTRVTMLLDRETKGALRYQEVDSSGAALELVNSVIGTLYLRKSALPRGVVRPVRISVELCYGSERE